MHISIVEDEIQLWQKMSSKLLSQGYSVSTFTSYSEFMELWNGKSHVYVIDIGLWDGNGFDIIDWLRKIQHSTAPILITSWYWDTERIVYWLNIGADDYMIKPCMPDEFIARINALTRRNIVDKENTETMKSFKYKDIVYFPETQKITQLWKIITLTKRELFIFELFIRNPKNIISRETVIEHGWYWKNSCDISDPVLNTTLSRIRKKFWNSFNMKCLYNFGYVLE